jgi:hypothetical protein
VARGPPGWNYRANRETRKPGNKTALKSQKSALSDSHSHAANGVDGYAYLRALFTALPSAQTADDYEALLPWRITLPSR